MLRTRFHIPAPGLETFVRFYVQREVEIRGAAVVHPVPARAAAMIEFDFGDPIYALDYTQGIHRKSPMVLVVGPQTYRRVELQLQGTLESFVIMFQPDGLHRLFSIPMHELTDRDYEARSVLGGFIANVRQRMGNESIPSSPHNKSILTRAPFIHPRVESMQPFDGERSCLFD